MLKFFVNTRLRSIPQFTNTSDADTFGVFCNQYRYQKLFDDDGRWLVQRCLCRHQCCAYALGHLLTRIPLNYYSMLFMWSHQWSQTGVASSLNCSWRICGISAGIKSKITDTRCWVLYFYQEIVKLNFLQYDSNIYSTFNTFILHSRKQLLCPVSDLPGIHLKVIIWKKKK